MVEVLRCRSEREIELGVRRGSRAIRRGLLVAFPTETVYGLGADALDPAAARSIFEAKRRPEGHPLIVHVDGAARARSLSAEWSERAARLAERFWPGPLTLILEKSPEVPDVVTGGLPTVGLRTPARRMARELVAASKRPIAAPSANLHGRLSPTRAEHVARSLGDAVDLVLDGGETEVGIESTILSLAADPPEILRPGMIGRADLEEVVGEVRRDRGTEKGGGARRSPGRAAKHYAPEASLRLGSRDELRDRLQAAPQGVAVVWRGDPPGSTETPGARLPPDPEGYAASLYGTLHRLDRPDVRRIWVELPPDEERWRAIRDRLRRAATE